MFTNAPRKPESRPSVIYNATPPFLSCPQTQEIHLLFSPPFCHLDTHYSLSFQPPPKVSTGHIKETHQSEIPWWELPPGRPEVHEWGHCAQEQLHPDGPAATGLTGTERSNEFVSRLLFRTRAAICRSPDAGCRFGQCLEDLPCGC